MNTRKRFETPCDLEEQAKAETMLETMWGVEVRRLPMVYRLDVALVREFGQVIAWAEFKRRNHAYGEYKTYIVSLDKWMSGVALSRSTGLPAYLVVSYQDGKTVWTTMTQEPPVGCHVAWGGRTVQKRDDQDEEPVIHIPIGLFYDITRMPG
jgi:hypothetical protein